MARAEEARRSTPWLNKLCCPVRIKKCKSEEEVQLRYDNYQQFLNTLMTIGTLLMGFIFTGTLLNYTYDGEMRREKFATTFDSVSIWACMFATSTVIISLLVSVRSNMIFRNHGPVRALRAMMNSTIWMGFAELSIYISVYLFIHSVFMYLEWAQRGPSHICYGNRGITSECAQTTLDLSAAAPKLCATWEVNITLEGTRSCGQQCWARDRICEWPNPRYRSEWFNQYRKKTFLLVHELADAHCRKSQLEDIADELCTAPATAEAKLACAQASTACIHADDCQAEIVHTMLLCRTVCLDDKNITRAIDTYIPCGQITFAIILFFRAMRIVQQVLATWRFRAKEGTFCIFVKELGVYDHFDSDSEEEGLIEFPHERGCGEDGREECETTYSSSA